MNIKNFLDQGVVDHLIIEDRQGFFNDAVLADGEINYNLMGQYLLFVGSDGLHNEMVESQWRN